MNDFVHQSLCMHVLGTIYVYYLFYHSIDNNIYMRYPPIRYVNKTGIYLLFITYIIYYFFLVNHERL